ncbi:MAG: CopK family periplasmic copper-binding protein [Burkholderiaceae bacterium]
MRPGIVIGCAVFAALAAIGPRAVAHHELERSGARPILLKDGSTLWMLGDQTMAVEDQLGRTLDFKVGRSFEAADGRVIVATSNESARLRSLIRKGHKGGS